MRKANITLLLVITFLVSSWLAKPALADPVWDIETVDSNEDVGRWIAMALDSNGYAHISYQDYTNRHLKYAAFNGVGWDINTIDSAGTVGWWTSMVLDSNGYAHISYWDWGNGDLKYAYAYCGYVLSGDMNDDCKFDFRDFALLAMNWLIDCDKNPLAPACVAK